MTVYCWMAHIRAIEASHSRDRVGNLINLSERLPLMRLPESGPDDRIALLRYSGHSLLACQ